MEPAGWPFADPPNVATFTVRTVVNAAAPVLFVTHDDGDGSWQFLPGGPVSIEDALLVSLSNMLRRDPTLAEVADLPLGWEASRERVGGRWTRSPSADD